MAISGSERWKGLARFDGVNFRVQNVRNTPQLGTNYISALRVTRDSTLWIGTTGAGLLRMRAGSFRRVTAAPELDRAIVWQIVQDRAGRIWAATNIGLVLIERDSVRRIFSQADALPLASVNSICEDSSGTILALTRKGIWKLDGECFFPYLPAKDPKAGVNKDPGALASSRGGGGGVIHSRDTCHRDHRKRWLALDRDMERRIVQIPGWCPAELLTQGGIGRGERVKVVRG